MVERCPSKSEANSLRRFESCHSLHNIKRINNVVSRRIKRISNDVWIVSNRYKQQTENKSPYIPICIIQTNHHIHLTHKQNNHNHHDTQIATFPYRRRAIPTQLQESQRNFHQFFTCFHTFPSFHIDSRHYCRHLASLYFFSNS